MPAGVHTEFAGNAQFLKQSLATEPALIGAALLTIYIVLGVLYESLLHPLTILSTLPSAGLGALLAIVVTGGELSVLSIIGIILLMGIVKKNAIMLVDFALEQEREHGLSPEQAIHAACLERFRPITMTSLAALLGAVPLAFGVGAGSEYRVPLGISIIGGLLVSQALTLYTTPVVYLALERPSPRPPHKNCCGRGGVTSRADKRLRNPPTRAAQAPGLRSLTRIVAMADCASALFALRRHLQSAVHPNARRRHRWRQVKRGGQIGLRGGARQNVLEWSSRCGEPRRRRVPPARAPLPGPAQRPAGTPPRRRTAGRG